MTTRRELLFTPHSGRHGDNSFELAEPRHLQMVKRALRDFDRLAHELGLRPQDRALLKKMQQNLEYGRTATIRLLGSEVGEFLNDDEARSLIDLPFLDEDDVEVAPQEPLDDWISLDRLKRCYTYGLHIWRRQAWSTFGFCSYCLANEEKIVTQTHGYRVELPSRSALKSEDDPFRLRRPSSLLLNGEEKLIVLIESTRVALSDYEMRCLDHLIALSNMREDLELWAFPRSPSPVGLPSPEFVYEPSTHPPDQMDLRLKVPSLGRGVHLGSQSTVRHFGLKLGSDMCRAVKQSHGAHIGKAFDLAISTDPLVLRAIEQSGHLRPFVLPSGALRLIGLRMRASKSVTMKRDGNAIWGLMSADSYVARIFAQLPRLRLLLVAAFSFAELSPRSKSFIRGVVSRLVHLGTSEDLMGRIYFSEESHESPVLMVYHFEHFILVAQALLEVLKALAGELFGVRSLTRWADFPRTLEPLNGELARFLQSKRARSVRRIVAALRVPAAHGEHWPDGLDNPPGTAVGHEPWFRDIPIIGEAAAQLAQEIVALGNQLPDWGLSEGVDPDGGLGLRLDPYPFAVVLHAYLLAFVERFFEELRLTESVSDEQLRGRADRWGEMLPALDSRWAVPSLLLSTPVPKL